MSQAKVSYAVVDEPENEAKIERMRKTSRKIVEMGSIKANGIMSGSCEVLAENPDRSSKKLYPDEIANLRECGKVFLNKQTLKASLQRKCIVKYMEAICDGETSPEHILKTIELIERSMPSVPVAKVFDAFGISISLVKDK